MKRTPRVSVWTCTAGSAFPTHGPQTVAELAAQQLVSLTRADAQVTIGRDVGNAIAIVWGDEVSRMHQRHRCPRSGEVIKVTGLS